MTHLCPMSARRTARPLVLLLGVAFLAAVLVGCGSRAQEPASKTATDSNGLFHLKVPPAWQVTIEQGLIAVYAAEELPASGELDALSLIILSGSTEDTVTPIDEKVATVIELRAETRGWQEYTVGDPEDVAVGNRSGVRVEVSGVDGEGAAFEGAYHLVRTSGTEVLIVAVSPAGQWADDREALDAVFEQWYWLRPETGGQAP